MMKLTGHSRSYLECRLEKPRQRPQSYIYKKKKGKSQVRRERRQKLRNEKKKIEQWVKRDCDTMLATRQTYSQRQKQRLALSFETPQEAENRAKKRKQQEADGLRKKKWHSPRPEDLEFDKDGLLEEVKNMKEGDKVSVFI